MSGSPIRSNATGAYITPATGGVISIIVGNNSNSNQSINQSIGWYDHDEVIRWMIYIYMMV